MLREWTVDPLEPDYDSALWTYYDDQVPVKDYKLPWDEGTQTYGWEHGDSYALGLAQVSYASPTEPTAKYFHGDQIGTTRAMTDDVGPPLPTTISPRIVYTAFGEQVNAEGAVGTRYLYAGKHGYESFDWTAFQHVGYRWYEPATGRFLQRDPIGIGGGPNVYAYVRNRPMSNFDPEGLTADYNLPPHMQPDIQPYLKPRSGVRRTPPRALLAEGLLLVTGGEDSWLDNPRTVKKVSRASRKVSKYAALAACGGAAAVLSGASAGVGAAAGAAAGIISDAYGWLENL
jgi:RHS repeat-associated protein